MIQTSVFGDRVPGVYYLSDFNNGELEDVLFILYAMCHSAEINATYGNFLTMSQNKGVDNAIGFRDDISNSKAIYWNNRFWYHTNNNYNLYSAAYVATYETALYPPITGNYSGLESWVLAGNWQTKLEPARYGN